MKITRNRVFILVVVGVLSVLMTTVAFAGQIFPLSQNDSNKVQDVLDKAVEEGTLTQEEVDEFVNWNMPHGGNRAMFGVEGITITPDTTEEELQAQLAEAVANGTMTQEQADKLLEMYGKMQNGEFTVEFRGKGRGMCDYSSVLDDAVTDGTITQEQRDALAEKFDAAKEKKIGKGPMMHGWGTDSADSDAAVTSTSLRPSYNM